MVYILPNAPALSFDNVVLSVNLYRAHLSTVDNQSAGAGRCSTGRMFATAYRERHGVFLCQFQSCGYVFTRANIDYDALLLEINIRHVTMAIILWASSGLV